MQYLFKKVHRHIIAYNVYTHIYWCPISWHQYKQPVFHSTVLPAGTSVQSNFWKQKLRHHGGTYHANWIWHTCNSRCLAETCKGSYVCARSSLRGTYLRQNLTRSVSCNPLHSSIQARRERATLGANKMCTCANNSMLTEGESKVNNVITLSVLLCCSFTITSWGQGHDQVKLPNCSSKKSGHQPGYSLWQGCANMNRNTNPLTGNTASIYVFQLFI